MTTELGTLHRGPGDANRLVFNRTLAHPIEKVWRAVTEPEHQAHWFPDSMRGERAVGARLRFVHDDDESTAFEGEMLAYEPPRLMEFRWGTDTIRVELAPSPDGTGTVLTLTDTFDELGKAARDGAGWHDCLDELGRHLDGTTAGIGPGPRWKALNTAYVEALGPEAATVGVPEGYELPD